VIATQDSRVHEDLPDTNFGGSADLRVRTYRAGDRRTLVSFPLPAVPANCTLASATLLLLTAQVAAMYSGSNFGFILRDRNEASRSAQQQTYRSTEAFTSRPELVVAFG
jgi:hypothetical protein